ncbi:MAG: M48 family metallopeptidase [Eubacteriales bacterium]|nr:M48 family metallopeptidase [Eubacteriales bacterium]
MRKMKTLWGSCSRNKGRISLNYYLYKASVPSIEYVILHELAHFIHPKHNKAFYDFLTIYMPDWEQRKAMLDYETVLGV